MKTSNFLLRTLFFVTALYFNAPAQAQNGDQILDGIGETGMIARYVFNGDLKDWSRNTLHAKFNGGEARFVNDARFNRKVLSLDNGGFVSVPAEAFSDLESLSISAWVYIRSNPAGACFFDFGQNSDNHFFASPLPGGATKIDNSGVYFPAELNKWMHVSFVIDVPSRLIFTYVDGKQAGSATALTPAVAGLLGKQTGEKKFTIGKSFTHDGPSLNAMIADFRIYRVPLSNRQSAAINQGMVNTTAGAGKREDTLPRFSPAEPQLYNSYLLSVNDVNVQTETGTLPRLPGYIQGVYKNGIEGPKVRVIWPADTDNAAVLKPGRYTVTGRVAGTAFEPKAIVTVKEKKKNNTPALKLKPFELGRVSLDRDVLGHDTKFIENRDKFLKGLAKTDPNSFLYMFRQTFGQPQPEGAKALGGWDSRDTKLRGHATGHYLTAIAQAYAGSGYDKALQQNFSEKMETMVNTLYDLSQLSGKAKDKNGAHMPDATAIPYGPGKTGFDSDFSETGLRTDYWNWGTGFISAYPPDQFIMLEKGAKYGGQKNQIWAPYYTLHKILSGLMDVYEVSGNTKALAVASGMGDWVYARLSRVPTDTLIKMWNTYIAGEYGGMNEAMARLYRLTGKADYLETAKLFDNIRVFFGDKNHSHGLAKNVDLFRGLHANQHIPQVIGSIETYSVSGDPEYYKIADNFWNKIVNDYMYSIGGVAGARNPANAECFIGQPGTLYENGFAAGGQNETCATYNMLKLTSDLFMFDQRGELMDYYERALYNHILASVAENTPANTYHVPLRPGSSKQFGNANMTGFTCCNGTALESSTKLQNSIYFSSKDNQSLYVNLFVPSTLDWKERNITITQTTGFPKEDNTKLVIKGSGKFGLNVRIPSWATKGFFVTINGKEEKIKAVPGSYVTITRKWNDGDVVEMKMPFGFHLEPVMDQQNIASLFYGPVLLAAQEPEARKDWRTITLDAQDISKSIKGDPKQLLFTIGDVVLKPFYETYGRHSVYLDVKLQ